MMSTHSCSCLCGKVTITAEISKNNVGACHCSKCRKWSGGVFLAIEADSVVINGEEHMQVYPSSDWGERAFCKNCGSNLFFRMRESGKTILAAGVLDDNPALIFDHQIFIEEKPDYYDFANQTKNMTGAELFAYIAEQQSGDK